MDRILYENMAQNADAHWWYAARRKILDSIIDHQVSLKDQARILEIGCGTGHNLTMLSRHGLVDAAEPDFFAREMASTILGKPAFDATLPDLTGIPRSTYELVALFDVLEHVEDDLKSLQNIRQLLTVNGILIFTVPAHQWMWSQHDVANHHVRRYSKKQIKCIVSDSGYDLKFISFFNSILFPVAIASRIFNKITKSDSSDAEMPHTIINNGLKKIFELERHLLSKASLPMGLSIVVIAKPKIT